MTERLEEIRRKLSNFYKSAYAPNEEKDFVFHDLKIEWLLEQVERVEELELEVNDWKDEAIKWNKRFEESEESHLETKELLHSTISEYKRYKQFIVHFAYSDEGYEGMLRLQNKAKKLIEGENRD